MGSRRHVVELPKTGNKSCTFSFENATAYSTEDLAALFKSVEEVAASERKADSYYGGLNTAVYVSYWRGSEVRKVRLKRLHNELLRVEVRKPDKLYDNVVERLGTIDADVIPMSEVISLVGVLGRTLKSGWEGGEALSRTPRGLKIRIVRTQRPQTPTMFCNRKVQLTSYSLTSAQKGYRRAERLFKKELDRIKKIAAEGRLNFTDILRSLKVEPLKETEPSP